MAIINEKKKWKGVQIRQMSNSKNLKVCSPPTSFGYKLHIKQEQISFAWHEWNYNIKEGLVFHEPVKNPKGGNWQGEVLI